MNDITKPLGLGNSQINCDYKLCLLQHSLFFVHKAIDRLKTERASYIRVHLCHHFTDDLTLWPADILSSYEKLVAKVGVCDFNIINDSEVADARKNQIFKGFGNG